MEKKFLTKVYFNYDILDIPLYQRAYEWKPENCDLLFNDLLKASEESGYRRNHFFGSIIAMLEPDKMNQMAIIDGQQRITTIALLLAAIRDVLSNDEYNIKSNDPLLVSKIDRVLEDQDDKHIFLRPVEKDREAYESIIRQKKADYVKNSNLTINYLNFIKSLKKNFSGRSSIDSFYLAINSLYVMPIFLTQEDDAQAVFESINSTGVGLYESDKIRNFILMNHPIEIQNQYYRDYWSKIEKNVEDISMFFRHYLIVTTTLTPKLNNVYRTFKESVNRRLDRGETFESLLEELLDYSRIYKQISNADFGPELKTASMYMRHINYLELKVTYPYIMNIIRDYNNHVLNENDVVEVFKVIDNYLVRHFASGKNSTGLNSFFFKLYRSTKKLISDASFVEKTKYVILHKDGASEYVTDIVLKQKLMDIDLYRNGANLVADLVLAILEDSNRDTADTLSRLKNGELSIEHIMPQTLSDDWEEMLGPDYKRIHAAHLHKLGNLTLTAYNSEYQNKSFEEKSNRENGFKDSRLYLNSFVGSKSVWSEEQIIERQNLLIDRFLRLIPELNTDCQLKNGGDVEYTLEEEPSLFTGIKVNNFSFEDSSYSVASMTDVLKKMSQILYDKNPKLMMDIATQQSVGSSISNNSFPGGDDYKISDDVYIFVRSSNEDKVILLVNLMKLYGINPEEVSISGVRLPPRKKRNQNKIENKFF